MSSIPPAVRAPAVAGLFYPGEARALRETVAALLESAAARGETHAIPKALIVPHAGYPYSGPVAASAYALLGSSSKRITRVVLVGPAHRVALRGLALPAARAFATPLGAVEVDSAVAKLPGSGIRAAVSAEAHELEHSLEVHVPFLQSLLDRFTLVPLLAGHAGAEAVAQALEVLWGGPETLIVVSSDLSHYLSYDDARAVDADTAQAILGLSDAISHEQACGAIPVTGLVRIARRRGLRPRLVDLRNSGDTAGDRMRVVGYGAFAFFEPSSHEAD